MSIPSRAVCHIAIVVRDLETTLSNWSRAFGMEVSDPIRIPPSTEVPTYTDGMPLDHADCKLALIRFANLLLEFVQPGEGKSPWRSRLDEHGEGFHNMSFIVEDRKGAFRTLASLGAPAPYHIGFYPDGTYAFVKTEPLLGIELNIKDDADNTAKIRRLLQNPGAPLDDADL